MVWFVLLLRLTTLTSSKPESKGLGDPLGDFSICFFSLDLPLALDFDFDFDFDDFLRSFLSFLVFSFLLLTSCSSDPFSSAIFFEAI